MHVVFGRPNCSFCDAAKGFLEGNDQDYIYIDVTTLGNARLRELLVADLGKNQVPQIFELIGGYEDMLLKRLKEGT